MAIEKAMEPLPNGQAFNGSAVDPLASYDGPLEITMPGGAGA